MAEKGLKAAMIAAVSAALKYKQQNPGADDNEILGYILKASNDILKKVD